MAVFEKLPKNKIKKSLNFLLFFAVTPRSGVHVVDL